MCETQAIKPCHYRDQRQSEASPPPRRDHGTYSSGRSNSARIGSGESRARVATAPGSPVSCGPTRNGLRGVPTVPAGPPRPRKSDPIDAEVAARNVLAGQVQGPTTRRLRSRFCSSRVVPAIDAAVDEPGGRGGSFERDDGFDQDETGVVRGDRPAIAWFTDPAGATPLQCRSMTHGRRMALARSRLFRAGNWRADPNGG